MTLQPVKIFRPDAEGTLRLVEVIPQKEIIRLADEKLNKKKFNKKKKSNSDLFTPNEIISKQN